MNSRRASSAVRGPAEIGECGAEVRVDEFAPRVRLRLPSRQEKWLGHRGARLSRGLQAMALTCRP